jgi:hypothetical protein
MSKRKIESVIKKMHRKSEKQRLKELKSAEAQAKNEAKLVKNAANAAKLGIKVAAGYTGAVVASGGTAVVAGGGIGGVMSVLGPTAVAAPPFSTAAAVVAGIGIAAWGGVQAAKADREKWLKGDKALLQKEIIKYKKKKKKWRKKKMAKLLRAYDKHLSIGNKKTISLIDGNLRNKEESNWRAKKAKIEIRLKAIYAVEYGKSYRKLIKGLKPKPPKITKKQALAEKKIVKRIKRKQANSIDPRTSPFPLLAPGVIGITPKLATADALQSRVSDVGIIKLAKMNPSPSAFKKISQSHDQAVALMKAPEKDLPKELQQPKKNNKAVIIGVSAVSALLVVGGAVALARK